MPSPTFSTPERRSLVLPVLAGLALLGTAAAIALHFFPARSVEVTHVRTTLLPTTTVFKSDSIVVGPAHTATQLFVATTVHIQNGFTVPIYLDDFTCTFTDPANAQLKVSAFQKSDLSNLQLSFPALKPLLPTPLHRETRIDPGQSLEGAILLSFPFTESQWNARKSATLEIDLYHQPPLFLDIR